MRVRPPRKAERKNPRKIALPIQNHGALDHREHERDEPADHHERLADAVAELLDLAVAQVGLVLDLGVAPCRRGCPTGC